MCACLLLESGLRLTQSHKGIAAAGDCECERRSRMSETQDVRYSDTLRDITI